MKLTALSSLLLVPLALCATMPENESQMKAESDALALAEIKKNTELITAIAIQNEFAHFMHDMNRIANDVIAKENEKAGLKNGPKDLYDLFDIYYSKSSLYTAQAGGNSTTSQNPLQGLVNGLGGVINGGLGAIGGALNGVSGAVGSILNPGKKPSANVTVVPTNSSQSGNGDLIGGIIGGIASGVSGAVKDITGGTIDLANVTSGLGTLVGEVTQTTGSILGNLTDGAITTKSLEDAISFAGSALGGILTGSKSIADVISSAVSMLNSSLGGDNPLGKFIQSISIYLSNNQDGYLANLIRTSTFVNLLTNFIVNVVSAVVGNVSDALRRIIFEIILGALQKIFGYTVLGFQRIQSLSASEMNHLSTVFIDAVRAQSPEHATYIQQIYQLGAEIIQKVFQVDPFFLTAFVNPTEANLQKAFTTLYKVIIGSEPSV